MRGPRDGGLDWGKVGMNLPGTMWGLLEAVQGCHSGQALVGQGVGGRDPEMGLKEGPPSGAWGTGMF